MVSMSCSAQNSHCPISEKQLATGETVKRCIQNENQKIYHNHSDGHCRQKFQAIPSRRQQWKISHIYYIGDGQQKHTFRTIGRKQKQMIFLFNDGSYDRWFMIGQGLDF